MADAPSALPPRVANASARVYFRRAVFVAVILVQLFFVVRAYSVPHKEFGFQMFPEASTWQAQVVRVTDSGDRIPVDQPWSGYDWNQLMPERGLNSPWLRKHADDGVDNQVAFLQDALDWLAANTPRDTQTRYYQATVTTWLNLHPPVTTTIRSPERAIP